MFPVIIVHGGAGTWKSKHLRKAEGVMQQSARCGLDAMRRGMRSIDAVESAVMMMENSGCFNAGRGSCRQNDGTARMDASIMSGADLNCGAVGAVERIGNPVSAARRVMESGEHVLLVGSFATRFAEQCGLQLLQDMGPGADSTGETVGAVALDRSGLIAAATSTGGLSRGMAPGRMGDSAIVGCGTYANRYCGASATGMGEAIIRSVLARRVTEHVELGLAPQEAAEESIRYLHEQTGGKAGIIVLDRTGRTGAAFNTEHMLWCVLDARNEAP